MGGRLSYPEADLSGKVVIVTGGNAGIGYETAKAIAAMGAHTIIACRSLDKANAAIDKMKEEISAQFPDKSLTIEAMPLDLASFQSTKDFTVAFKEKQLPLHILINNAGLFPTPQLETTQDGYELAYQVNHLSHFLMTIELLPIMLETAANCGDVRIVIVSSDGHKVGSFEPDNMNGEQPSSYGRLKFYCKSKLYNVMHAYALQRRLQSVGITVSTLHPGAVNTEIIAKSAQTITNRMFVFLVKPFFKDAAEGAATSINCAVNTQLNSQQCFYYADTKVTPSNALSRDEVKQEELWKISSEAVKEWMSPELYDKYGSPLPVGEVRPLEETTPATEETTPATEETTPATEETTPPTEETTPATEETTPATEETKPATEETTPANEETKPATEDTLVET